MAEPVASVYVDLGLNSSSFQAGLKRTGKDMDAFGKKVRGMRRDLSKGFDTSGISNSLRSFSRLFAGAVTIAGAQKLLDTNKRIQNTLKVTGLQGDALRQVYDKLYASAQANAAPFETLAQLYARVAQQQGVLKATTGELLNFVDGIAVALRVAGGSAESASGALTQLGQALGGGVVRAEEFSSLLEGAPTILQAAASGIRETGGSVSELRKLMLDGQLSSEALFRGFLAGSQILREQVATSTLTVEQAWTKVYNAAINAAGAIDDTIGISGDASGALADLAYYIDLAAGAFGGLAGPIQTAMGWLDAFRSSAQAAGQALGDVLGTTGSRIDRTFQTVRENSNAPSDALTKALTEKAKKAGGEMLGDRVTKVFDALDEGTSQALQKALTKAAAEKQISMLPKAPVAPGAISLANFMPPATAGSGGGGGGGRKGRGGGGGGGSDRGNDFDREVQSIQQRTAALNGETEALAKVNPALDDYGYAIEKARTEHDLLTAAQEAGVAITPELQAKIAALAESYAQASVASEKLREKQDEARSSADDFAGTARSTLGGFISDLRNGVDAADALANALDSVVDKLLDVALNALIPSGGGGWISGLIGGAGKKDGGLIHAASGGRIRGPGGGRGDKVPAMLSDGEYVVNAAATRQFGPLLAAINSGKLSMPHLADGGLMGTPRVPVVNRSQPINFAPVTQIDARGSTMSEQQFRAVLNARDARLTQQIMKAVPGRVGRYQARGV